jgi:hypothetical protein
MFLSLFAHCQEALHKQQLVYCVRIMSAGCYQGWSYTPTLVAVKKISRIVNEERDILRTIKAKLSRLVTSCGGTAL